jgi:surface antigen
MKKIKSLIGVLIFSATTICFADSQTAGTIIGGVAGGIVGSQVIHGTTGQVVAGTIGGAAVGALLGSAIGKSMDDNDRYSTKQAVIDTPIGEKTSWTNSRTGKSYTVRPVSEYHSGNQFCRKAKVYIHPGNQMATTIVCRRPNGNWYVRQ